MERHRILGEKVALFRRSKDSFWYASTSVKGREWRKSTKEQSLSLAKEVATDWYMDLTARAHYGTLKSGKRFSEVAKLFEIEYEATTLGHRSPKSVKGHKDRIRLHLLPWFGNLVMAEIKASTVQQYRIHRMTKPNDWEEKQKAAGKELFTWKPPARNTMHNEIVTLSMVLKTAKRYGWIEHLPELADPFGRKSKVEHRGWFTPNEYKKLYEATRYNAAHPKNKNVKWYAEQLHDYVLFATNTGLRTDEARLLEFRDVQIVDDPYSGERILEIEVRGKRGVGYCKSMPGAVLPFERLRERLRPVSVNTIEDAEEIKAPPKLNDKLFPNAFIKMFNNLLADHNLKFDRNGKARSAYSLRHSYICFRLLEGADIYQVAKNCRTSVEMIEKFYAAHIKDMIDTSRINVQKNKQPEVSTRKTTSSKVISSKRFSPHGRNKTKQKT